MQAFLARIFFRLGAIRCVAVICDLANRADMIHAYAFSEGPVYDCFLYFTHFPHLQSRSFGGVSVLMSCSPHLHFATQMVRVTTVFVSCIKPPQKRGPPTYPVSSPPKYGFQGHIVLRHDARFDEPCKRLSSSRCSTAELGGHRVLESPAGFEPAHSVVGACISLRLATA